MSNISDLFHSRGVAGEKYVGVPLRVGFKQAFFFRAHLVNNVPSKMNPLAVRTSHIFSERYCNARQLSQARQAKHIRCQLECFNTLPRSHTARIEEDNDGQLDNCLACAGLQGGGATRTMSEALECTAN